MVRHKIAVIDDEEAMVQLLSVELESEGYDVVTACDGITGWKLVRETVPELIILDIMMPELTGYDIIRLVKEDPALKKIPIIMLTAKSLDDDIQKGLDLGASDYVTKPFHAGLLIRRVTTLLQARS